MDLTHLHLIITHLPIFGIFLGILLLIYGLYINSSQTLFASYLVFSVACLGGLIAYVTGESAEETVEHIRGISKSLVESHEESAEVSVIGFGILWVVSFLALFFKNKLVAFNRKIAVVILVLSVICFALAARTGYLGGQIRHTEVGSPNLVP
ncbi:DUF2231 domain-containing protein [Pedobacter ginsengisoli]|uniref:DUF2231 domain-containing protein n=1 Tax=Pedobacter ginsengisoli TaxID=363852 RepID=UPI00254D6799|nr:DUF2231 domain-containing protein [Pedobacter ginsengisoli]